MSAAFQMGGAGGKRGDGGLLLPVFVASLGLCGLFFASCGRRAFHALLFREPLFPIFWRACRGGRRKREDLKGSARKAEEKQVFYRITSNCCISGQIIMNNDEFSVFFRKVLLFCSISVTIYSVNIFFCSKGVFMRNEQGCFDSIGWDLEGI